MNRLFILTVMTFFALNAHSQQARNTRSKDSRNVIVNENSIYELNIEPSLIVIGDSIIQMYPNEKLFIHVDANGNKLSKLNVLKEMGNENNTLIIEFKQIVENRIHKQMMLTITNPFEKDLYFKSSIFLLKQNKWVSTTVLPVMAGKVSYEIWPDIITSITISSLHFK